MNELLRRLLNLPPQASTVARDIDTLHYFVITATMVGALFVASLAAYYLVRYRRCARRGKSGPRDERESTTWRGIPLWLEGLIIGGLLSLFTLFWVIGFRQYVGMRVPPEGAMEVYVTAKKWMWSFAYPDGRQSNAVLYVPANRPVKLIMSSRDVIHSFFVPAFRIKQDVVPGRMTTVWFEATTPGTYWILCAEYCGTGHSTMRGQVVALDEADYERLSERRDDTPPAGPVYEPPAVAFTYPERSLSLAQMGARVSAEHGCLRCHTVDGTPHIGPTWRGAYLSNVMLEGGGAIVADEAYLTESMMDPLALVHAGYPPVMPAYHGLLTAAETAAIVEYIKSLREPEAEPNIDPPPQGPIELEVRP